MSAVFPENARDHTPARSDRLAGPILGYSGDERARVIRRAVLEAPCQAPCRPIDVVPLEPAGSVS
jgi:hypothetical protein